MRMPGAVDEPIAAARRPMVMSPGTISPLAIIRSIATPVEEPDLTSARSRSPAEK